MPTVSIVIPTYRHQHLIQETLDAVFVQTFTDYEVIVVNDGSPDDTNSILLPLEASGRIRYIEQKNQGQSAARNRGAAEAKGEFIAFLDDDDLWPTDKLERQVAALKAQPEAVMVYGECQAFGAEAFHFPPGTGPSGRVKVAFLQRNWILSPGQTLIRAEALQKIGGFDQSLWGTDDWDLYIRLADLGTVVYCPAVALYYRVHPNNASKDAWRMFINSCAVQRKHMAFVTSFSKARVWINCRRFIWASFVPQVITQAEKAEQNGDFRQARKLWRQAFAMKPYLLKHKTISKHILKAYLPYNYNQVSDQ